MLLAPTINNQIGIVVLEVVLCTICTTVAAGPIALATSLDPCANAIAQAVNIVNIEKIFSTLVK